MGMVTTVGKSLLNAGAKVAKIASKNPKMTIAASVAAVGGYTIGKMLTKSDKAEKKEESSTLSKAAKFGLIVAGGGLFLGTIGKKLIKNAKVQKVTEELDEKITDIKMLMERFTGGNPKSFNHIAQKLENFVRQKNPEGIVKDKIDLVMKNFENHISKLKEERCYFKGTSEEFSKRLQEYYKDFKKGYPEYTDYISKHLDEFMSKV